MHRKKTIYRTLIVSSTDCFTPILSELLPNSKYASPYTVSSICMAKQVLSETTFDFVIINSPLPDDSEIPFAIDLCATRQTVVLILVKNSLHTSIHNKVAEYGIFTLPKPTTKSTLIQAAFWMESAREHLRQMEQISLSIEGKKMELQLINKAKWILIREQQMNENEAHHYIEKQSMDCCLPKKFVAEKIIRAYT